MPDQKGKLDRVRARLLQAGFYRQHASAMFFALRFLLLVLPILVGVVLAGGNAAHGRWHRVRHLRRPGGHGRARAVGSGDCKAGRQRQIRRALPDALDVIVICLEGGLSMPAAFARVTEELGAAYPLLAAEMNIVRKQIELGQSTADAFREFADRFDVDELRSLALLIGQAEKYGASLVRTLRIQADGLAVETLSMGRGPGPKGPAEIDLPHGALHFSGAVHRADGPGRGASVQIDADFRALRQCARTQLWNANRRNVGDPANQ